MADELYQVLGVKKAATARELRDAYRALAKKHHPDRNPGDNAAEDTFKRVQAAYDILSDADKRRQYDAGEIDADGRETPRRFYREYANAGGDHPYRSQAGFDDLGDIFADLFRAQGGSSGGAHVRIKGGDLRFRLDVPFLDAANGATRRLTLPDGQTLDVAIPAGHGDGQVLRLKGKGMPGIGGGDTGDAYIEIRVEPHPMFQRRERDILVELPVALHEAVLGARVTVPTIHGPVAMAIPAGSNAGDTLRLKGKGIKARGHHAAGDQLVTLKVVLPDKADAELTEFLKGWAEAHGYDPRKTMEAGRR